MGDVCANLHVKGSLEDGRCFIDTRLKGGIPINLNLGEGRLPEMVEREIMQMEPHETRSIRVPAREAYGEYDESLIESVPKASIPNADSLPVGQYIMFASDDEPIRVKVVSVDDDTVVFDHNHELAGFDLLFDIELFKLLEDETDSIEHERFFGTQECGCKDALGHGDHHHGDHAHSDHHHHAHA